eukprot:757798-Hanusia_phi.AAC.1
MGCSKIYKRGNQLKRGRAIEEMQSKGEKLLMETRDIQVISSDFENVMLSLPQVDKDKKIAAARNLAIHPPPKRFTRTRLANSSCMSDPSSEQSSLLRCNSAGNMQAMDTFEQRGGARGMIRSNSENILHALSGLGQVEEISEWEKNMVARRLRNRQVGVQIAREESRPLARFVTIHL